MTKIPVPLRVEDVTVFTRTLSKQLGESSPSHLSLMNMVARAAGFQNLQHMRAALAVPKGEKVEAEAVVTDNRAVERALRQFDQYGRLQRWPSRRTVQTLALWGLWASLPAHRALDERDVNRYLSDEHLFEDPATLRRTMISCGLMTRKRNGTGYRRVERKPTAEASAVIRSVTLRRQSRSSRKAERPDA